jgi:hypothetical protein
VRWVAVALAALVGGGCAGLPSAGAVAGEACAPPLAPYTRHALYFGLSSPLVPGRVITPEIWRSFSSEVLTRHFPAGMTVLDSYGEWRRPDGSHFGEGGKVVIHLASLAEDAAAVAGAEAIIAEAKRRFGYRSVLWEKSEVCAAF